MSMNRDIVSRCVAKINARRAKADALAEERLNGLVRSYPEFAMLEKEMKSTLNKVMALMSGSGDIISGLEKIRNENLAIQKRRRDFIRTLGFSDNYLEPQYECSLCGDTGYVDNQQCECLVKLINAECCKDLNARSPLSLCKFDTFDLGYYDGDDTEHMKNVYNYIKNYADTFNKDSGNLLFFGGTGLGKTHLSLAVADTVIRRGYNAVYGQAQSLFNAVAEERFSKDGSSDVEQSLLECDLLIIDDLGAEFVNQMTQSVLYSIINTRLLTGRSMIISTNIPLTQLDTVYHSRISSRLSFEFEPIPFVGKDIRQKKKRENKTH